MSLMSIVPGDKAHRLTMYTFDILIAVLSLFLMVFRFITACLPLMSVDVPVLHIVLASNINSFAPHVGAESNLMTRYLYPDRSAPLLYCHPHCPYFVIVIVRVLSLYELLPNSDVVIFDAVNGKYVTETDAEAVNWLHIGSV